jgi:hypothetical protein
MALLGFSHITYAPGFTSETHPGGPSTFTDDEWIEVVFRRYSVWVLDYAERLISDPNSGFAILLLLYPYFEMITRYRRGVKAEWKEGLEFFSEGLSIVFDLELASQPQFIREGVAKWLYMNLRNDLAHGNLTGKGIGLSDDGTDRLWWDVNNGLICAVGVNPRKWVERVREHFDDYRDYLLDPKNADVRSKFLKYAKGDYKTAQP